MYIHVWYLIRYFRQGWRLSRMMDVNPRVAWIKLLMSFDALVHSIFRRVRLSREDRDSDARANTPKLTTRLLDVILRTFDLGLIAFGGPPVHFQIFHRRFVDGHGKPPWIDEQTVSLVNFH